MDQDRNSAREHFHQMSFKEKVGYFWDYYKIQCLLTIAFIGVIISVIKTYGADRKEEYLYVELINGSLAATENSCLGDLYLESVDVSTEDYAVTIDSSLSVDLEEQDQDTLTTLQVVAARIFSGEIDVFAAEEDYFDLEIQNYGVQSLKPYLSEEELEKYAAYLYYEKNPDTGVLEPYGFCFQISKLTENGIYPENPKIFIGIGAGSDRVEEAISFIEYLQ